MPDVFVAFSHFFEREVFSLREIIIPALVALPFGVLWTWFWTSIIKFKNKNDRIVDKAKAAGRYTTAHFVKLEAGFVCVYEYEVDGCTYRWQHAITPNSTERVKMERHGVVYAKQHFPDMTIYWPNGHPEKADFDGFFGRGVMAAIIQFAPLVFYLIALNMFNTMG